MKDCPGELNVVNPTFLQTGCHMRSRFFECRVCHRVHDECGDLAFNRQGHAPYLENGSILNKDEQGIVMSVI
jgi:hypothetical protein